MKNLSIFILVSLFAHSSYSQIDSVVVDKNHKKSLLESVTPIWMVDEGRMTLDQYYGYFKPVYLNNDTLVDFIYHGPSGGEGFLVSIYLNTNGTLKELKSETGAISKIYKPVPDSPAVIHFTQSGCCDDPHNYLQIWTLTGNKIFESDKYHFLEKTEIPENLNFKFSIKIKNTPYYLRATPSIVNDNLNHNYKKGNIIAEFSAGDIGHVLASRTDNTGRLWYFVIMESPKNDGFHNYDIYRHERWLGWLSSRYVDIINYTR